MKKLLMLGTSNVSCEIIRRAKNMGIYTIVTDYLSPEKSIAKLDADEYWMINTSDIDCLQKKCIENRIDGIICGVSEFNIDMALELTYRLDLPFYCSSKSWEYSRDKSIFKQKCRDLQVPVAKDYYISQLLTDEEIAEVDFPVVVKPADLSANRGVSFCYDKISFIESYKYAKSISNNPKIIVEKMLHGQEYYGTYAIANGEISLLALNAMYAQPGTPSNCYVITSTVTSHVERFCKEINPYILKLLKAIGCTEGVAWVQVMLDSDDKFYVIEMGYRMDGELVVLPYKELIGFDVIEWLIENSLGIKHTIEQLPPSQDFAFTGTATGMYLWTNKALVIKRVEIAEELLEIPGLFFQMIKHEDDEVDVYRPVGVVTFATDSIERMIEIIQLVNEKVHVYNENGEDVIIKYTDFDHLRDMYEKGLRGE